MQEKLHIYNSCPAGEEGPTRRARVVYVGFFIRSSSTPPSFQLMLLLLCRPWYSRGNLAQSNFTSLRKLLEGSTGYFLHMWDIHWVQLFLSFLFQLLLCKLSIPFMKGSGGVTKRHCFFVIFDSWIKWASAAGEAAAAAFPLDIPWFSFCYVSWRLDKSYWMEEP